MLQSLLIAQSTLVASFQCAVGAVQFTAVAVAGGASVMDCASAVPITWTTAGLFASVELALFQADSNGLQVRVANVTAAPIANTGSYVWNMGCRTAGNGMFTWQLRVCLLN
jgi:hypothetical protein